MVYRVIRHGVYYVRARARMVRVTDGGVHFENAPSFPSESTAITINLATEACFVPSSLDRGI